MAPSPPGIAPVDATAVDADDGAAARSRGLAAEAPAMAPVAPAVSVAPAASVELVESATAPVATSIGRTGSASGTSRSGSVGPPGDAAKDADRTLGAEARPVG